MSRPSNIDWKQNELSIVRTAPAWFDTAINSPFESRIVAVAGCDIHFLKWNKQGMEPGVLLVHGGGAHASWWRFIAPLLNGYEVAAIDLSGMGDSGVRQEYSAALRSEEIQHVLRSCFSHDQQKFLVGHSFGGYMSMRFAADYGNLVDGIVIVDSPIYKPEVNLTKAPRRALNIERFYPSFEIALERFKLLPPQSCSNEYIVEFVARHSIRKKERGWTWKFDIGAMGGSRWEEPFDQHLKNSKSRMALIYGEHSALVNKDTVEHMGALMPSASPIEEIPDAAHHVMLDQPKSFVSSLKKILGAWTPPS